MRKPIGQTASNPKIADRMKSITALEENFKERKKFLSTQYKKLLEEYGKNHDVAWADMRKFIVEEKLVGDWYNTEKWHLHFDQEMDMLYACDGADHNPLDELFSMIKGPT